MSGFDELVPADPVREEVAELDRALPLSAVGRQADRTGEFPRRLLGEMGRRGLLGLTLSQEIGGRELPVVRAARGLFELASRGGTLPAKLSLQPEFSSVLAAQGTPALRETQFRPLVRGERLIANQLTEAGAGSDLSTLALRAVRNGDQYVLTGEKTQAAFADVADAAIVYARTSASVERASSISALLVPQDLPGIERTVVPDLGEHWMRRGTIRYREVVVPADHLLGEEGRGLEYVKPELDHERALLGAVYLGVAWSSWIETVRYVGDRKVGGRPLSSQEAVSFPLVEDRARMIAAWELLVRVLAGIDAGSPARGDAALAKWFCAAVALEVVDHAMQFHGGRGYSEELPFAQRYRDLRSSKIAHGTDEVMHLVAARDLWSHDSYSPGKG